MLYNAYYFICNIFYKCFFRKQQLLRDPEFIINMKNFGKLIPAYLFSVLFLYFMNDEIRKYFDQFFY